MGFGFHHAGVKKINKLGLWTRVAKASLGCVHLTWQGCAALRRVGGNWDGPKQAAVRCRLYTAVSLAAPVYSCRFTAVFLDFLPLFDCLKVAHFHISFLMSCNGNCARLAARDYLNSATLPIHAAKLQLKVLPVSFRIS